MSAEYDRYLIGLKEMSMRLMMHIFMVEIALTRLCRLIKLTTINEGVKKNDTN